MLIMFRRTRILLNSVRCSRFLRTRKQWSKWSSKAGSPTMRHVSRTRRVALEWLFDRINLDPKIQIKYVDTKHQLADMLTKGNFTRDEWNNLLLLCSISHFSSICCAQNFSSSSCPETMAKRMQEEKGEERIVAQSKTTRSTEITCLQKENLKSWSKNVIRWLTLNTCSRWSRRQPHAHRLELDSANCGYEESRREQAQLHEDLAPWEKALRDIRIRNIHEMEELKRAQEMRVDEFWKHKQRKSCYDTGAHFTGTGIARKGEWYEWFKRISRYRNRLAVENYLTFPVSLQSFQVLDLCWAATKACDLIHGICLRHSETFLAIHEQ